MPTKRLPKEVLNKIADKYRRIPKEELIKMAFELGKARLQEFQTLAKNSVIPLSLEPHFTSAVDCYNRALKPLPDNLQSIRRRAVAIQLYDEFIGSSILKDAVKDEAVTYLAAVLAVKTWMQDLIHPTTPEYKKALASAVMNVGWYYLADQYLREIGIEDGIDWVVDVVERHFEAEAGLG